MLQGLGAQHSGEFPVNETRRTPQLGKTPRTDSRGRNFGRDVMERILALMAEEQAKLAEEERLDRGETEGSVNSGRQ